MFSRWKKHTFTLFFYTICLKTIVIRSLKLIVDETLGIEVESNDDVIFENVLNE